MTTIAEQELKGAMTVICEKVDEQTYDLIVEAAKILLEDADKAGEVMSVDEAVHNAAAQLYLEDSIDEAAFGVCDAVMDEYANRPIGLSETLETLAENMTEAEYNQFLAESVSLGLAALSEAYKDKNGNEHYTSSEWEDKTHPERSNAERGRQQMVPYQGGGSNKMVPSSKRSGPPAINGKFRPAEGGGVNKKAVAAGVIGAAGLAAGGYVAGKKIQEAKAKKEAAKKAAEEAEKNKSLKDRVKDRVPKKAQNEEATEVDEATETPEEAVSENAGVHSVQDLRNLLRGLM